MHLTEHYDMKLQHNGFFLFLSTLKIYNKKYFLLSSDVRLQIWELKGDVHYYSNLQNQAAPTARAILTKGQLSWAQSWLPHDSTEKQRQG